MNRVTVTVLFALLAPLLSAQASHPALSVGIVPFQTGAPVSITYLQTAEDFPFKKIGLKSLSDRPISSVRLGVLFAPANMRNALSLDRVLVISRVIPLTLNGGIPKDIDDLASYFPAFLEGMRYLRATRLDASLGVISVEFSDGRAWKSEVATSLRFPAPQNTGTPNGCKTPPILLASRNPEIILANLSCDSNKKSPTTCQLAGSGCVVTPCGCAPQGCYCGEECDCTSCVWHNP